MVQLMETLLQQQWSVQQFAKMELHLALSMNKYSTTRMRSSRMRTVRCSGRLVGWVVSAQGVCGCLEGRVSA